MRRNLGWKKSYEVILISKTRLMQCESRYLNIENTLRACIYKSILWFAVHTTRSPFRHLANTFVWRKLWFFITRSFGMLHFCKTSIVMWLHDATRLPHKPWGMGSSSTTTMCENGNVQNNKKRYIDAKLLILNSWCITKFTYLPKKQKWFKIV